MVMVLERRQVNGDSPWNVAIASLDQCIGKDSIHASGGGAYANGSWARDFCWTGLGVLESENERGINVLENLLDFYISHAPNIPYRYMEYNHMLFQIGLKIPSHKTETVVPFVKRLLNQEALKGENPAVVDSFLVLDLAANFCTSPNVDPERRRAFWDRHVHDIAIFMAEFTKPSSPFMSPNGLVKEGPLTSRADCLYKSGNVLLTNVYWYTTLKKLSEAASEMENPALQLRFGEMASDVHTAIDTVFWDQERGHYCDWVDKKGQRDTHLDSLANSWAIISGIADEVQSARIVSVMHESVYKQRIGLVATADRPYEHPLFEWILRTIEGTGWFNGGEDSAYWPEMTFTYAAALQKMGLTEMADIIFRSGENLLMEHRTLHETYDEERKPIKVEKKILGRIPYTYRSAESFGMALGIYLWIKNNWGKLNS